MKIRVTHSIEDMDFKEVGDETYHYPLETNVLDCLKRHFIVEQDMDSREDWEQILDQLRTGEWRGGRWTREGDTFLFQGDVCWYRYEVLEDDEDGEDRPNLEELAEAIHDNSDGHDMLSLIEDYLSLIDIELYREKLEDYDLND